MLKPIKNLFISKLSDEKKEMMMKLIELLDNCGIPREFQDKLLTKALKLNLEELGDLIYEFSNLDIAKEKLQETYNDLDNLCLKKSREINKKIINEVDLIRKEVEDVLNNFE